MAWRLGNKISRGVIDHIFSWESIARKYSTWTAHDAKLFLMLTNLYRDIGKDYYQESKAKKIKVRILTNK
jgi:hypothetical protein